MNFFGDDGGEGDEGGGDGDGGEGDGDDGGDDDEGDGDGDGGCFFITITRKIYDKKHCQCYDSHQGLRLTKF